jgi:hypothetical protein
LARLMPSPVRARISSRFGDAAVIVIINLPADDVVTAQLSRNDLDCAPAL